MLYDDYFKILDGILEILALNNGTEEIKIFLLEILKPWANKMLMLSENKVSNKGIKYRLKQKKNWFNSRRLSMSSKE